MLKIISTGFEGGERAALDAAIERQAPWGGACPLGRSGQYAPIPDLYFTSGGDNALVEADSSRPTRARHFNAQNADGTLLFCSGLIPQICKDIIIYLRRKEGLYLIVDPRHTYETKRVCKWIAENNIRELNISSPPKNEDDPFTHQVRMFMLDVLTYTTLYETRGVKIWSS
jgi:hypothetical protein